MAINIKEILADGLLELCQTVPLESITIKQLLQHTGVSRQTFYNHFLDKNDLIQYIYLSKMITDYNDATKNIDFKQSLCHALKNMKKYHYFMKQACLMEGQNNLRDYMFQHCIDFDLKWHQSLYGEKKMPDALKFATKYHAAASSSMTLSWILSDMPVTCEEMAELITTLRSVGMDKLFQDGDFQGNPYQ